MSMIFAYFILWGWTEIIEEVPNLTVFDQNVGNSMRLTERAEEN